MRIVDCLGKSANGAIAIVVAVFTLYTALKLCIFLSDFSRLEDLPESSGVFDALVTDCFLIGLFILQHSFMASPGFKNIFKHTEAFALFARTIYVLLTNCALNLLICVWVRTPSIRLWSIEANDYSVVSFLFTAVHWISWVLIYGGCLTMDLPDLVGLKQVYYDYLRAGSPDFYRGAELKEYRANIRHPSFILLFLILWLVPTLTMDRILLAAILTFYMVLGFTPTQDDYEYHKRMYSQKQKELKAL